MTARRRGSTGCSNTATDLFDRASIEALVGRLVRLLEAAVADSGAADRSARHSRAGGAPHDSATSGTTPRADPAGHFARSCSRRRPHEHPTRSRVVFEDQRSPIASSTPAPISWRIICAGSASAPEMVVGLCVERSPEMLVALLGILKAGGAYLPLDPAYPQERLAFMTRDAGAGCWSPNRRCRIGCRVGRVHGLSRRRLAADRAARRRRRR